MLHFEYPPCQTAFRFHQVTQPLERTVIRNYLKRITFQAQAQLFNGPYYGEALLLDSDVVFLSFVNQDSDREVNAYLCISNVCC